MENISSAIKTICDEKGLSYDAVISTIESALAAAYRKDFGEKNQNIHVEFDAENGASRVFDIKTVVEDQPEEVEELVEANDDLPEKSNEVKEELAYEHEEEEKKFNPKTDIQISEAGEGASLGDEIKTELEVPEEYGRMAAQTAKQVIIQRLREAEREMVFNDFKDKENEVVAGVVQRKEGRMIFVDLGKSTGILPPDEQIKGEIYNIGDRVKVHVKAVNLKAKGPEILLSRTSDEILRKVFYLEIPEISNGMIELKSVAREAGFRSKAAVFTEAENVDPIGSCVGQRGTRIQTIINELGGEKVDIIEWDEDPIKFITNALSPAKVVSMDINEEEKKAIVYVASDQLSLAIGKGGQNARLAAKLTGWKIDIMESKEEGEEEMEAVETNDELSDEGSEEEVETIETNDNLSDESVEEKKEDLEEEMQETEDELTEEADEEEVKKKEEDQE